LIKGAGNRGEKEPGGKRRIDLHLCSDRAVAEVGPKRRGHPEMTREKSGSLGNSNSKVDWFKNGTPEDYSWKLRKKRNRNRGVLRGRTVGRVLRKTGGSCKGRGRGSRLGKKPWKRGGREKKRKMMQTTCGQSEVPRELKSGKTKDTAHGEEREDEPMFLGAG